ncbi:DUF2938 domain-containing protein [Labrys neptuniae]
MVSGVGELLVSMLLVGIGATIVMDLWALLLKHGFAIASLDYAMVGRWIGHLPRGRLVHAGIGRTDAIPGEKAIGWLAHYAIGVVFAGLLLTVVGPDWLRHPTPLPALVFGVVSLVAPFFILQPGLGAGIAARKTPNPGIARLRSLAAHLAFGAGLYVSALLIRALGWVT